VTWLRGRVGVAMITSLSSVIRTARHTRNRVRSTVWRSLHGAAISSCAATRGSRSSRPSAATSWTPTGGQRLRAGWASRHSRRNHHHLSEARPTSCASWHAPGEVHALQRCTERPSRPDSIRVLAMQDGHTSALAVRHAASDCAATAEA